MEAKTTISFPALAREALAQLGSALQGIKARFLRQPPSEDFTILGIDIKLDSDDLYLNVNEFSLRLFYPAITNLSERIEEIGERIDFAELPIPEGLEIVERVSSATIGSIRMIVDSGFMRLEVAVRKAK